MGRFAAILPHTKLYGGVKRFFELGNSLMSKGHVFIVFTPEGLAPEWYIGDVQTASWDTLNDGDYEAVFITEMQFLPRLLAVKAKLKVFYFVRASDNLRPLKKHPEITVFANSTNVYEIATRKYGLPSFKAFGGVNTNYFVPKKKEDLAEKQFTVVMVYGRLVEKKKGTKLVVKACERLYKKGYKIRLLLFDTPVSEKATDAIRRFKTIVPYDFILNHPVNQNLELYHRADLFVAAEKNAGISNTAAEAMASGIPVIATESGTKDFLVDQQTGLVVRRWSRSIAKAIEKLINDAELRDRLVIQGREKIEALSWDNLANTILNHPALTQNQ